MADDILSNVQAATVKMNSSTSRSIASFTSVLDGAGSDLQGQLSSHLEGLQAFLAHQERLAGNTIEEARKFKVESDASVVAETGSTPKKRNFSPLRSLR
jgi:hypothetical protein